MKKQSNENSSNVAVADPAATVIPLRDKSGSLEVLLIQRNQELPFQDGAWVFPGGRVEQSDYSIGDDHDLVLQPRGTLGIAGPEHLDHGPELSANFVSIWARDCSS